MNIKTLLERSFTITKTIEIDDGDLEDILGQDSEFPEDEFEDELDVPDSEHFDEDEFEDELDVPDSEHFDEDTESFGDDLDGDDIEDDDERYQGIVRNVKGAKLVYKRKQPDNTYDELWIFTATKDLQSDMMIKRYILSGTDINPQINMSDDGEQRATLTNVGNLNFLSITGMPN